jgi:hypothetical protein
VQRTREIGVYTALWIVARASGARRGGRAFHS